MRSGNILKTRLLLAMAVMSSFLCGQNQTPANAPSPVSHFLGVWHREENGCGYAYQTIDDVRYNCKNITDHISLKVEQGVSDLVAEYSSSTEGLYARESTEADATQPATKNGKKGYKTYRPPLTSTNSQIFTLGLDLSVRGTSLLGGVRSGTCNNNGTQGVLQHIPDETFTAALEGERLKLTFRVKCGDATLSNAELYLDK